MNDERLEAMCANSYRNFHTKGFDYLCLHRSEEVTLKAYFFDEEVCEHPEIVMPHDHRYGFITHVAKGGLSEKKWRLPRPDDGFFHGRVFQHFAYRTPLNGGSGFTWERETVLTDSGSKHYLAGQSYVTKSDEIHTLADVEPGTIIVLTQLVDELPVGEPTNAFRIGTREPPNLSGLYDRMTPDHAKMRLEQLRQAWWPA